MGEIIVTQIKDKVVVVKKEIKELHCGIVMPIASMDGYSTEHWLEVKEIITEAVHSIEKYQFKVDLVSESDGEIDVIQKRIVQNIYNADIVVCDVSGKNPNVMFELGMRLTFDKPTIIIKDDDTSYMFDTNVIEHITYPKSLRFKDINNFKKNLSLKILKTLEKAEADPNFSTFIKNFGKFQVPNLQQTKVTEVEEVILEEINNLRNEIRNFQKQDKKLRNNSDIEINSVPGLNDALIKYFTENKDLVNIATSELMLNKDFRDYLISKGFRNPNPKIVSDMKAFMTTYYERKSMQNP